MFKSIAAGALIALAVPAFAGTPPAANSSAKAKDPNRKICETIEETGSRLGSTRICMTAEQWEQQRRDQRADVERVQRNSGISNGN